jgi:hypothetical protein
MTCLLVKFLNDLIVNVNPVQFSIYRKLSSNRQQRKEAEDIWWFLNSLCKLMKIDDVEYGLEPPDFVFHILGKSIGVELTKLNPKIFVDGSYAERGLFKEWEKETKAHPQSYQEFPWGEFSVRDSLAAFSQQFEKKCDDVKRWKENFPEKWLLAHVDKGSPFGEIFPAKEQIVPGREEESADWRAKIAYSLFSICQRPHPFDYVILFSGISIFAFPANGRNLHKLPVAKPEVLARGAKASDEFLEWSSELKSCKNGKS